MLKYSLAYPFLAYGRWYYFIENKSYSFVNHIIWCMWWYSFFFFNDFFSYVHGGEAVVSQQKLELLGGTATIGVAEIHQIQILVSGY